MREGKPTKLEGPEFQRVELGSSLSREQQEIAQDVMQDTGLLRALLSPVSGVRDSRIVARELIAAFGSLGAVLGAPEHRLAEHADLRAAEHLGRIHTASRRVLRERIKDRPIIGSWEALKDYLLMSLRYQTTETLMILFLDAKNGLIADETFCRGTMNHVPLYPREIAKRCLQLDTSAIIMVHNHPSGNADPSKADIEMTRQVIAALGPLGIAMHDHAIVGRNDVVSLRARRLL